MDSKETQDNQYFDGRSRKENRPFYDWYSLAINFPYTEEVFNEIMKGNITDEYQKNALTDFFHEYIHYLQNFGSLWGIPKFIELVHSTLLIHNSLVGYDNKYQLPIDISKITEESLSNGLHKRAVLREKINEHIHFKLINPSADLTNYSCDTNDIHFAILSNDCFECNICMKTLKESQAFIAEKLFLGFSDDEIHECIKSTFQINKIKFEENYFYWILFDFFKVNYGNIKEIGRGLFLLIQDCLNRANPFASFKRFIDWLNSNSERFLLNIKLPDLVYFWRSNRIETYSIELSCNLTFDAIENFCSIIDKHKNNDEFLMLLSSIIEFSRRNMYEFNNGIFQPNFDFSDVKAWYTILERFGTGIIIFKDSGDDRKQIPKTLGTSSYQDLMHNPFKFLFSINYQIEMILQNKEFTCPFKDELAICNYNIPDDSAYYCKLNAFLVDSKKEDGLMCLFDNTASVMGFKKSLEF